MNVLVHNKPKKSEDGRISFPDLYCWNPETKTATIAAQVSGKRVSCRVTYADIKSRFKNMSDTPLLTVKKYKKDLEVAARKLIESKTYEKDGSIKIRIEDLSPNLSINQEMMHDQDN